MTQKKQPQLNSSTRGGYRDNAGRKSGWKNSDTCTIRIPKTFASQLVELARRLDNGERLSVDSGGQPCIGDPQPPTTILEEGCSPESRVGAREKIDNDTESNFRENDLVTQSNSFGTHDLDDGDSGDNLDPGIDIDTKSKYPHNDTVTESIIDRQKTSQHPEQETEIDTETKSMLSQDDFVTESNFIDGSQSGIGSLSDLTEALKEAKTILRAKKSARESIIRLLSKLYSVQVDLEDLS
jgi:hypothetical protein